MHHICSSKNSRRHLIGMLLAISVMVFSGSSQIDASMGEDLTSEFELGDIYVFVGTNPIWMGNRIRYSVFETCKVEARFVTPPGEIIILLPMGEQSPGQYTLPWHRTPEAAIMAGPYRFELYFGDEYAAKLEIIVLPPPNPSA